MLNIFVILCHFYLFVRFIQYLSRAKVHVYILKYDINKLCCSVISYPESRIFYNFRIKKYILTKKCYSPHQKINVNTLTITIFKEKKIISFPTYGTYITEPHIDLALRARSILVHFLCSQFII